MIISINAGRLENEMVFLIAIRPVPFNNRKKLGG